MGAKTSLPHEAPSVAKIDQKEISPESSENTHAPQTSSRPAESTSKTAGDESIIKRVPKKKIKSSDLSTPELAMIKCRKEKKAVDICYSTWFTGRFLGFAANNPQQTQHEGAQSSARGGEPTPPSASETTPDRDDCDDLAEIYETCFMKHVKHYKEKRGMKVNPKSFVGIFDDENK